MEKFLILQNVTVSEIGHECGHIQVQEKDLLLDVSGKYHIQHVDITKQEHTK
jgi:dTDP-4-dehydrorhamnose 3,5-epimerase-like enzyme